MLDKFEAHNQKNDEDVPTGGRVRGVGLAIDWQDGPIGKVEGDERLPPNGAFVETVIAACVQRLEFYQASRFACDENHIAIMHLNGALEVLNDRTKKREARGVEGTHKV